LLLRVEVNQLGRGAAVGVGDEAGQDGVGAPGGEPSARNAEVAAQPCSLQFPLPAGLNQPFSWPGAVPDCGSA
jgi:hypothetical protein